MLGLLVIVIWMSHKKICGQVHGVFRWPSDVSCSCTHLHDLIAVPFAPHLFTSVSGHNCRSIEPVPCISVGDFILWLFISTVFIWVVLTNILLGAFWNLVTFLLKRWTFFLSKKSELGNVLLLNTDRKSPVEWPTAHWHWKAGLKSKATHVFEGLYLVMKLD